MRRLQLPLLLLCGLTATADIRWSQLHRSRRSRRSIQLTEGGQATGGLVVWMPVSVVLSSLASGRQPAAAAPRSDTPPHPHLQPGQTPSGGGASATSSRPTYDVIGRRGSSERRSAASDGRVEPLLSRVEGYLELLNVSEPRCRLRAVCQLAQQEEALAPVSKLMLNALRRGDKYLAASGQSQPRPDPEERFALYRWAALQGELGADCPALFHGCPSDVHDLISLPMLWFWQLVARAVPLHLTDD